MKNESLSCQSESPISLHNLHCGMWQKGRNCYSAYKLEELYDGLPRVIVPVAERLLWRWSRARSPIYRGALALATSELASRRFLRRNWLLRADLADVEYWIRDTKRDRGAGRCCRRQCVLDQFNDCQGNKALPWMLKSYIGVWLNG